MSKFIKISLLSSLLAAGALASTDAFAQDRLSTTSNLTRARSAPELSGGAGAAGLVTLLGAAAIYVSRRRRQA